MLAAILGNLLELARSHVDARRGLRQALHEAAHALDVGRLGQKLQLVEVLLGLADLLSFADDGDQHGALTTLLLDGGLRLVVALFSQNKSPFRADRFRGGALAPRRPAPTRCYKYRVSAQCGYPMG